MGNYSSTTICDFEKNNNNLQAELPINRADLLMTVPIPPYDQGGMMWPKFDLSNTYPKTLNGEPVRQEYEKSWGEDYCCSSLWVVNNHCCDGSRNARVGSWPACSKRMTLELENATHPFSKPPVSSLHPVNKSPSAPITPTSFPSVSWAALAPRPARKFETLGLAAQSHLWRCRFSIIVWTGKPAAPPFLA